MMKEHATSVRRWRVSGRVQGVGFRYSTRRQAQMLGIERGWARNLASGDVDVCAAGSADALARLHEWLQRGPALARVTRVEELPPPPAPPDDFATGDG